MKFHRLRLLCPPCMKLEKEVFSQAEFIEYVTKNYVPLYVEFPPAQSPAAGPEKGQRRPASKYKLQGVPMVVVLRRARHWKFNRKSASCPACKNGSPTWTPPKK